jgi:hypothetical protein
LNRPYPSPEPLPEEEEEDKKVGPAAGVAPEVFVNEEGTTWTGITGRSVTVV